MIVVSDMSGTLTTGSAILGAVDWVRHHQSALRANLFLASTMSSYYLAKRGVIDFQKWVTRKMVSAMHLVKDPSPESVRQLAEWTVEKELWPKRRQDMLAQLSTHIEEGARVYIASSAYQPTAEAFAGRFGAHAIGTPIEIDGDHVRFSTDLVAGDHKIQQVLNTLGVDRVDVAYGDTWADIPLLEHADHPVAIYPDDRLRREAHERGWEIIGKRADSG